MTIELRDYLAAHCPPSIYSGLTPDLIKDLNQLDREYPDDQLNGFHTAMAISVIQYQYADIMIKTRQAKFEQ